MTEKLAEILAEVPAVGSSLVETAKTIFSLVSGEALAMLPIYIGLFGVGVVIAKQFISFRN